MEKVLSLDVKREHFMDKAHHLLDLMFLASLEQNTETAHALDEEFDTCTEIVWRFDYKRKLLMEQMDAGIGDFLT